MPTTTFAPTQLMTDVPEQVAMQPTQLIQEEMAPTQLITSTGDDQKENSETLPTFESVEGIRSISVQPTYPSQEEKDDLLGMLGSQDPEEFNEQEDDVEEDETEVQKEEEPKN